MQIVGIIGGVGPESTIDYYRSFFAHNRELRQDGRAPSIVINSIDVSRLVEMVTANDLGGMTRYLLKAITRLADAGANFAMIAANTPHIVFDKLQSKSPIPLLSIVEVTCDEVRRRELQRPLLLGTKFTMSGKFYPEVFQRERMSLLSPAPEEQEVVHAIYMQELLHGVVKNGSRRTLIELIATIQQREEIDSVILGGTELSLILKEKEYAGVAVLDTTQIHVRRAVELMQG